ncbi:MAG: IS1634 family transposase [Legionellales bacterium]|nr:IS1634 family transposase [Legionellales bacterium]
MFIRKKKNKGGTTSILLIVGERKSGLKHSTPRLIKNFGASSDEEELKILIQRAEEYKQHLLSVSPKAATLKITSPRDIKSCLSFITGFTDVYGKFFNKIFSRLNLKPHELKKLHDLIIMRIANPASKRKTAMISRDYDLECNVDSIYKLMDQLTENTIKQAKKMIYQHSIELLAAQKETVDVMFYDLTTVYFETNSDDALRNFGFSKDGKCQHVQIMLAVIVTKHGLPIDYEEFPGNCYEGHTLIPVLEKIKTRYNIDQTVLVADAALMNKINLAALTERKIHYVISARIKNTTKNIQEKILNQTEYEIAYSNQEDIVLSKAIKLPEGDTLIAFHSSKRARKDGYEREKALDKIQYYLNSTAKSQLTSRLKKPYVKINKGAKLEIDWNKLEREKQFDGFFGIQTNLENSDPKEILNTYRGLWQVEQTFRIAKSNLEIRPVFHYSTDRIRAHFLICYMSLALIRYVEFELKKNNLHYPIDRLHFLLSQMRVTKIYHADRNAYVLLEDPPPELISVYQALNIKWHKKFSQEAVL